MSIFNRKIHIYIETLEGNIISERFLKGVTVEQILEKINYSKKDLVISAIVNNVYTELNRGIYKNSIVKFVSLMSEKGLQIYRNTAILILSYAVKQIFQKNILNIGPSIQFNYFFDLQGYGKVSSSILKQIEKEFANIVNENLHIKSFYLPKRKAYQFYKKINDKEKMRFVLNVPYKSLKFYKINNFQDICDSPVATHTGIVSKYKFVPYSSGFLIEFPRIVKNKLKILKLAKPSKISKVFLETRNWYKLQGVSDVSQLNLIIKKKQLSEIINISEALHEKRISYIADKITDNRKYIKFVLIAGPSSSGKTTFAKRLSIQLRVNGLNPVAISLDNYFLDREKTPKDEKGNYNFDCLEALDLELFNKHLEMILKGKDIEIPVFNFHKGRRDEKTISLPYQKDHIILIEGIHGLNEKLTYSIPKNRKFKIYVSAVSQLRITNNYRIATRDTRLIRRIVRDKQFRDNDALKTLQMWPSVRRGEEKYIFPFQEDADIIFNSALVYETAILKPFAFKFLKEVPKKSSEYAEAKRLMEILGYFFTAPLDMVPKVSILREFTGGSVFHY